MPPPLPRRYEGVWARTLLWSRDTGYDTTTTVRWAQSASLFGDVRQPAGVVVTTRLEECDEAQLKCVVLPRTLVSLLGPSRLARAVSL
jgi:hypothetical protein